MKQNYIIGGVIGVVILAVLFIAYQALVVVPREEIAAAQRAAADKARAESIEKMEKARAYDECISDAYDVYSNNWDNTCINNGDEADCQLYPNQSNRIDDMHETAKAACVTLYK